MTYTASPKGATTMSAKCPNFNASYCEAHDYDHVLERQEQRAVKSAPADPGEGTLRIDRRHLHLTSRGVMVTEASDLGMQFIPQTLLVPDRAGNARAFDLRSTDYDAAEHEVTGWRYLDAAGLAILVIND